MSMLSVRAFVLCGGRNAGVGNTPRNRLRHTVSGTKRGRVGQRPGVGYQKEFPKNVPFVIQPDTPAPYEMPRKQRVLPKAQVIHGIPDGLLERNLPAVNKVLWKNIPLQRGIKSVVKESRVYDWHGGTHVPKTRFCPNIFFNILRLVNSCFPVELMENTEINAKVKTRFTWHRGEDRYMVHGRPPYLITSKDPLPIFANPEIVEATKEYEFPDGGPVGINIDLMQSPKVLEVEEFVAEGISAESEYKYPHTLLYLVEEEPLKREIYFKLTMFQFAHLAAHAVLHRGAKFGEILKNPLTMQGIGFNGKTLFFSCFQLNTLDLEGDGGIKNIAWEKTMSLYGAVGNDGKKAKLVDFDNDGFKALLSFLFNYDRHFLETGEREVYQPILKEEKSEGAEGMAVSKRDEEKEEELV